jgi:hypothetical protein
MNPLKDAYFSKIRQHAKLGNPTLHDINVTPSHKFA